MRRHLVPLGVAALLAACASGPRVHVLDNAEYGETVTLETGDILEVQVYSRPASGFEWRRDGEGSPVLVEIERRFDSLRPDAADAGGVLTLRLRAGQPGREVLRYSYGPTGAPESPPSDRVDVVVEVE